MGKISKTLRFEILARDGFRCRYCGRSAPDVELHVDHLRPSALGGGDDAGNLVTACGDCNLGKSDRALSPAGEALVLSKDKGPGRLAKARAAQSAPNDPDMHWIVSGICDFGDIADGQSLVLVYCETHGRNEWHWVDDHMRKTIEAWGPKAGWLRGKAR